MLNLLTSAQIREAELVTIRNKPIASLELMEAAAKAFTGVFAARYPERDKRITIYCGTGNNGGDGLAIGRLLQEQGYSAVRIVVVRFNKNETTGFLANLERAKQSGLLVADLDNRHYSEGCDILIDALLGSGINRPLSGDWQELVKRLNALRRTVVSVDIPTGLYSEGPMAGDACSLTSTLTVCFELPRISFFLPDTGRNAGEFVTTTIGLDRDFLITCKTGFAVTEEQDIRNILKPRSPFSHKGTYGHTLIVAGKPETMGAAILASSASVYSGSGLTTAAIPEEGLPALNSSSPEVMVVIRNVDGSLPAGKYTSVVAGPGLGTGPATYKLMAELFASVPENLVLDADALTVLSQHPELFDALPPGTILTPHMKEFDRLFGGHKTWWERVETAKKKAAERGAIIVLKNRYTLICTPGGTVRINPTGGPAMASGGSGDVLSGILGALLSCGYSPEDACIAGVFIHGWCGQQPGRQVIPASELIRSLPSAFWDFSR
jgi:NAD(P)H-hydrate epimerase